MHDAETMPHRAADRPDNTITVLTFGTFDYFHEGHKNFLRQARAYGNWLVTVVARDETVFALKGHYPDEREENRLKHVLTSGLVDEVVLGSDHEYFQILDEYPPDVIVLGYDQQSELTEQLEGELATRGLQTKIVHAQAFKPEQYKSTLLRERHQGERH